MDSVIFSIIIPLYNKEKYIVETLQSIFNQDFTNYEIIIVNDCSTDNSVDLIEKTFADKNIKIVHHNHNKGLSAGRNTGIKNATGKYITFIDADDVWNRNFLTEIFELTLKFPQAHIFGTRYSEWIHNKIQPIKIDELFKKENHFLVNNYFSINVQQPIYCYSSVAFRKEVFNEVGFFNENINYAEDIDFNIRANLKYKLAYSSKPCCLYRMGIDNQITSTKITNKSVPEFDKFEALCTKDNNLKKFLDFQRYTFAKQYKIEGNYTEFFKLYKAINLNKEISGLNFVQLILLKMPKFVLQFIQKLKAFLQIFNIKIATYK